MPSLNGITVNIISEETPLEEYSTSFDPDSINCKVCWVPSSKDKSFSVQYRFLTRGSWDWECRLKCDGLSMRHSVLTSATRSYEHDKARNGNTVCSMVFSELIETDTHEEADHTVNPLLGVIEVKFWRVKKQRKGVKGKPKHREGFTIDESPVHESKKVLTGHRVRLGPATPSNRLSVSTTRLDARPFAVFKFYYRPRPMLQALGYVPPSTPGTVNTTKRSNSIISLSSSSSSSDSESDSDVRKVKIAALKAELDVLQRGEDGSRKKREAKGSKNRRSQAKSPKKEDSNPGPNKLKDEAIDLCSD